MKDIEKVHVHVGIPPKDYPPGTVENLVPTYRPPARLGAADQPNRPPPATHLRLDIMVDRASVTKTGGLAYLAGHLLWGGEPLKLLSSPYKHVT